LDISEGTAEIIRSTAKELGYVRNEISLSMKSGKSNTIGCMVTSLALEWGGKTLDGALAAIHPTPFSVRVASGFGFDDELKVISDFVAARVAGIFICNVNPPNETVVAFKKMLHSNGIPYVSNNCAPHFSIHKVEADNEGASEVAVKHLFDLGHRRIALIGADDSFISQRRKKGFIKTMKELSLPIADGYLEVTDWLEASSELATERLLKNSRKAPTGIVCANHFIAAIAMRRAKQLGYSIPKDISIVGISDETLCEVTDPPLTTVCIDERKIGSECIKLLIELIDGRIPVDKPKQKLVPVSLITRGSTSPPNN
jgi:LacI family transcriptional regulator